MTSAPPHHPPAWTPLKAIDKPPHGSGWQLAGRRAVALTALILGWILFSNFAAAGMSPPARDIQILAAYGDRSTGSDGAHQAADYIQKVFSEQGYATVGRFRLNVPVRKHTHSELRLRPEAPPLTIRPLLANSISPGTLPTDGAAGPLIYAGNGELSEFNGLDVSGAFVLMEMTSGKNWLNAANLGARALIYIDRGDTRRPLFHDKFELTPIDFPRFWVPADALQAHAARPQGFTRETIATRAHLTSQIAWQNVLAENIFCLVPGSDETLRQELVVVEAFYDSTVYVAGRAPGADEAVSIAALLDLARYLRTHPPERSVLLLATAGHAQSLAGMREAVWSFHAKSKEFILQRQMLSRTLTSAQKVSKMLNLTALTAETPDKGLVKALIDAVKTEADQISRRLMRLRLQANNAAEEDTIRDLAQQRQLLRGLSWRTHFRQLSGPEKKMVERLIPQARAVSKAVAKDARQQMKLLKEAKSFRQVVRDHDIATMISLHLSSHGDGVGAFNQGWLYKLRPQRASARVSPYSTLEEVLRETAAIVEAEHDLPPIFKDSLRPSRLKSWQSYLPDRPQMGGEISALAGLLGITLATTHDVRDHWGTPSDTVEKIDWHYALQQNQLISGLIRQLAGPPTLYAGEYPRDGLSTLNGRARFIRQGELFAEQPAPGTMILAFQGPATYHAMIDHMGRFQLHGISDKKLVFDKVVLEGYRFDPDSGQTLWAIDKKQTGKNAYRVKMQRNQMETDLIMFACRPTTLFSLLEPRSFRYMTKIELLDARLESPPLRYWWSRIDTRESTIDTLFMEPDTRFKLTLTDSVLNKKMILTGATERRPEGIGYRVDDWPRLYHTEYRVAEDMWRLLDPRLQSLEENGIHNERLLTIEAEGLDALERARRALTEKKYDRFMEAATRSWALAIRVYNQVEQTQKDVLFGVLFYIALFVPFAFCAERLLFGYRNIHKRIVAFLLLLLLLIAIIYNVHPAFDLAYSPTVVILAFFIMGLSLIVTLIIFFRFEEEMAQLQNRATRKSAPEISRWKAFVASFFLGVSNLRRRRLRTALTCSTLIILTFTIMSFTAVKSSRMHARIMFRTDVPYQGFLLKTPNWQDLPSEALGTLANTFNQATVGPRVWLENEDRTRDTRIPVVHGPQTFEARGIVGLSAQEGRLTGFDRLLVAGEWFANDSDPVVIISQRMADNLGIRLDRLDQTQVHVWGTRYKVIGVFDGKRLDAHTDLDGEPLTPVTFPSEVSTALTEIEMEAIESGDDVQAFQSRYQHTPGDLTVYMPYRALQAIGGRLKGVALVPPVGVDTREAAQNLADRFGLELFSGELDGTYLYHSSDTIQYSGVPNILIPLVISIFIVLNTMIGSVYERRREIGIYTSVGLAPSHVAFLFIAEAMAFAVLSVVLGYLVAQVAAKLFAGTALWSGITVNYSSLAGVAAMVLVIIVVLISVIYPSRVAANIAIPDVNRSWKMPDPKQSRLEITLPFLVKLGEQKSLGGFLLSHFTGHQDVSHGLFSTGEIAFRFDTDDPGGLPAETPEDIAPACFQMSSKVWLAPFDFGIMQHVEILLCPAEDDAGFLEIRTRLTRKSGEVNAWGRINKSFVNDLRKQLLIWRSMDGWTLAHYEKILETAAASPAA
jgi:hypothetical protein